MYKIFEIIYNSGEWSNGNYHPHYYIAQNKEEVIKKSKIYQAYAKIQKANGGDLYIWETDINEYPDIIENIKDFNITISKKELEN